MNERRFTQQNLWGRRMKEGNGEGGDSLGFTWTHSVFVFFEHTSVHALLA
jgi:hypothetical protein